MNGVFISYRREDVAGFAGRICDRLSARFGDEHVFIDVEDIEPGQDFPVSIEQTIERCACLLAIIGPRWLERLEAKAGGTDFVRAEIVAALKHGVTVIPVLIGTPMPAARDLPPDLVALTHRNAVDIRHERFADDLKRLESFVGDLLTNESKPPLPRRWSRRAGLVAAFAATGIVVAGLATTYLLRQDRAPSIDGSWVAEMQQPGLASYRIRLRFAVSGERVTGTVSYPTGEAVILDGLLQGRELSYHTSHVPQFESTTAAIEHRAEVLDADSIRLTTTSRSGTAVGTARRVDTP